MTNRGGPLANLLQTIFKEQPRVHPIRSFVAAKPTATFKAWNEDPFQPVIIRRHVQRLPAQPGQLWGPATIPAIDRFFDKRYGLKHVNGFSQLSFPYELMLPSAADLKKPDNRFSLFVEWLRTCTDFGSCPLPKRSQLQNLIAMLLGHIETQCENPRAEERFVRFKAPLFLLYVALFYNQHVVRCYGYDGKFDQHKPNPLHIKPGARPFTDLYIAQASLSTLPDDLQKLFPTPDLIKDKLLGKGAVYGSSLWLGVEPTYTPWHRDPNHNILTQLHSKKKVRLMPPKRGQAIFERVQAELGSMGHTVGDPKIRGAEMMQGLQKRLLHDAIWGDNHPLGIGEGILSPSDSLFIPMGWWHSIKSAEDDDVGSGLGQLNASVNWWFR